MGGATFRKWLSHKYEPLWRRWVPLWKMCEGPCLYLPVCEWELAVTRSLIHSTRTFDWDISVVYKPFWLWHCSGATSTNLVTKSTNAALFPALFRSLKSIQPYLNQLDITSTQGNHLPMHFVQYFIRVSSLTFKQANIITLLCAFQMISFNLYALRFILFSNTQASFVCTIPTEISLYIFFHFISILFLFNIYVEKSQISKVLFLSLQYFTSLGFLLQH